MVGNRKRAKITSEEVQKREKIIKNIDKNLRCHKYADCVFEKGNNKTGYSGGVYDKVLVWNMPYVITCPGASELCKKVCYNAAYPINENSMLNYNLFCHDSKILEEKICEYLETIMDNRIGIRLHSSGDFFSKEYIDMWTRIVKRYPTVKFWAYTRSWVIPELKKAIKELENNDNISVYYSWDETMEVVCCGHKRALIGEEIESNNVIICPEQYGIVNSCADCGICANNKSKDISFYIH